MKYNCSHNNKLYTKCVQNYDKKQPQNYSTQLNEEFLFNENIPRRKTLIKITKHKLINTESSDKIVNITQKIITSVEVSSDVDEIH